MGRTTTSVARAALLSACALGLLAGPAVAGSEARADEPKKRAGAGSSHGAGHGGARTGVGDLRAIGARIDWLNDRAESATEAYNAADERAARQRRAVHALHERIDRSQRSLAGLRDTAGAMARAQYRSGAMPAEARLILRRRPEQFLSDAALLRKGQRATRNKLDKLAATRARLDRQEAEESAESRALERNRKRKAAAKKRIERDLKRAELLTAQLGGHDQRRLWMLEDKALAARQARWLRSGVLDELDGKPSKAGRRALAFATDQIGKDYEWGAEGPRTYDCSGLTQRAWRAAGISIPRTSQEQWKRLRHIPVRRMRPGDLIIYKRDAGHVGMYAGDGKIVHAPRTGRQITFEGAGALPILGVVRPDK